MVVVGDALLDRDVEGRVERLCPDAPVPVLEETARRVRPGGAGLAAALLAANGVPVTLVTALARDAAGAELARALLAAGVDLLDLGLAGATPEKVRLRSGQTLLRLDRGGAPAPVMAEGVTPALRAAIAGAMAVLVSDYGRGVAGHPEVRGALDRVGGRVPLVWDPHPRGARPLHGATVVTPNLAEARALADSATDPGDEADVAAVASRLAAHWQAASVCVTRAERGAVLADADGELARCPAQPASGDPCGAGDRFATTLALRLAHGDDRERAVAEATRAASAFVAAGGAAAALDGILEARLDPPRRGSTLASVANAPSPVLAPALELIERVRREGGTVAASGGCFDLLHVGHVRALEAAAALGDCLVVLLNSDRSVRELKGADRPLVGEEERAEMLRALACVDEVAVFDEPTPRRALRLLRPDVWAKGGDYDVDRLPESEEVASWGGRTAILPYLAGRSTTRLIEEVGARVAS